MKIEHIAIWARDLERMKEFYVTNFKMVAGDKYYNPTKKFTSYFLAFEDGPRIELMHKPGLGETEHPSTGLAHIALSLGSKEKVDEYTRRFRDLGIKIIGEPRTTGDGYYESVIQDIEGNSIELTV